MRKPVPLLFANDSACILFNVKMQQHGDNIMPHPRYHTAAAIGCTAKPSVVKVEVVVGVLEPAAQTAANAMSNTNATHTWSRA